MTATLPEVTAPAPTTTECPAAEVLERAAWLVEEFGHCREFSACQQSGTPVVPLHAHAASFCALGAMTRAHNDLGYAEIGALEPDERHVNLEALFRAQMLLHLALPDEYQQADHVHYPGGAIALWNDKAARDGAEVAALMRKAAAGERERTS